LLRPNSGALKPTQFAELCQAYGLSGITNPWLSRTLKSNKLNHDTDAALRPLVLLIEALVEKAKPYPIAFDDVQHIQLLLSILDYVSVSVESPKEINSSAQQ
jgi:hypothetical protein